MPKKEPWNGTNETESMYLKEGLEIAKEVARSMQRNLPAHVHDDLLGGAHLGLVKALKTFDSTKGSPFGAYSRQCMKNAIYDDLRRDDNLSRHMRLKLKVLMQIEKEFESIWARKPTREELAKLANNASTEEISQVMALGMVTDETSKLFLTLETPFMVAREVELKREIASLLEHLSEEESTIIRGVFNVGKTYQELAEDLETNEVNVATVFHQTLRKLRKIA